MRCYLIQPAGSSPHGKIRPSTPRAAFSHSTSVGKRLPAHRQYVSARVLEERHAGIGDGRVVLIRDTAVVAEDLPFFGLDQSQQAIDG
jgi:hypothetical protein